ncbi:hypothetical protein [Streptomyces virginiae]|uniref:hypothetical protein n=1 Tax=Streptomyces virginiae TaxID=1961 RepID=UPI003452A14D
MRTGYDRVAARPSAVRTVADRVLDSAVRDRVELVPGGGPVPAGGRTVLLCRLLERVEGADGIELDTEAALRHLRLKAAFGSGVRTEGDFERIAAPAGLRVAARRDIGWDHRRWEPAPAR